MHTTPIRVRFDEVDSMGIVHHPRYVVYFEVARTELFDRHDIDGKAMLDLGYRFVRDRWGRGYATECSHALIAFGFDVLGLEQLVAYVMPGNAASVRVLEKTGFVAEGRHRCPADDEPALRFVRRP